MKDTTQEHDPEVQDPALRIKRCEPLPWETPKPLEDDPHALARVEEIMQSPGYRQADHDVDFLNSEETRGVRLQIDYLKAETLLKRHGVEHTIAVFGGTRITEPLAAQRQVDILRSHLVDSPDDKDLQQRLAIAKRILEKSRYYDVAREFGRLVGRFGKGPHDTRITLITGGGPGMMEAANRGTFDVGAKSIGLNITLPREQYPNPYITPDLCFRFHYFAIRKLHFLKRAKALVAFPGGYGTLDELFETLTLIQTRTIQPLPVVLVGQQFWQQAMDVDFLVAEGVIDPEDKALFWYAETAEEIWASIQDWHCACGTPLLNSTGKTEE